MAPAYQPGGDEQQQRWAIRRRGDRCFHEAEEFVPGQGYIVGGVMVPLDEIVDVRPVEQGGCDQAGPVTP